MLDKGPHTFIDALVFVSGDTQDLQGRPIAAKTKQPSYCFGINRGYRGLAGTAFIRRLRLTRRR